MSIIDSRGTRKAISIVLMSALLLLSAGCAGVPYQEMSDARQAIEAAKAAVTAGDGGSVQLERARALLGTAEDHLHADDFSAARETAERAKALAIEARERAAAED